ncbi:MAG: restriction endonuclease, SacI family [Saprospiraceae bacterium]|nr:restriction endonuclease, SacI family [Saprospiraceae bacterium]
MAENITKADAEKVLLSAFRTRCSKSDEISYKITSILKGNHKTYKYILINGLLAKATNDKVNALALQSGAPIPGAYDARSLCHSVLVPFERDFLQNALGGSNEPFLNKPARFTHLSDTNAVRRGDDKIILGLLIEIFSSITTSFEAHGYLACALDFLNQRIEEINALSASSKEAGDIDVFKEERFYYAIEVKDKAFTSYDLQHAFKKIQASGWFKRPIHFWT